MPIREERMEEIKGRWRIRREKWGKKSRDWRRSGEGKKLKIKAMKYGREGWKRNRRNKEELK